MATVFNDLPGVRRKEIDLSDNLVPRIGNTVGTVIRSYKGAIKRPILITSQKDFVAEFGAPVFTSGAKVTAEDVTVAGTGKIIPVPDYGYGAYAAMNVLTETSSVVVVRDCDYTGKDAYSYAVGLTVYSSAVSALPVTKGLVPTQYTAGDPFDKPDYISTIETSATSILNTTASKFLVSHTAPSVFGDDVAITVELPTVSADWIYSYDGYPVSTSSTSDLWDNDVAVVNNFGIAANMIKVSVYVKPSGKQWDDMYTTTADRDTGKLRISPAEVFYGTVYDALDSNNNSLFIEDTINGHSQYIYMKYVKGSKSANTRVKSTVPYVCPNNIKTDTPYYVYRSSLITLSGGLNTSNAGLGESTAWDIFRNKKQLTVDVLLCTSWESATKQAVANVVADRLDCFAELQSNPPGVYKAGSIIENERYGYTSPSYVGLSVGFSQVFDTYNNKNIWLPNAIFETLVDLRSIRMTNPWTAPAGTNRGIVPVNAQLMTYSDPELDLMIGRNLNPISLERGYGFVVWSQRTAQLKKSALDRKNVRFSLLYIENNIEVYLKQFIFENNTAQNRQRCYDGVYEFLDNVKASGGLYEFDVICDETNNTPSIIDANEMSVDIYLKPVKTAEIINFTTVIAKTGAAFNTVRLQYV